MVLLRWSAVAEKLYKKLREIVSTKWLNQNLSTPNLIVLDASVNNNANEKKFKKFDRTIPNARIFDLKNVFLDKTSSYPNTFPKPKIFEGECRKLGINSDSKIVVFDNSGIFSSPRVWWLFKVMGHQQIAVLNGGLPDWIEKGFQTEREHLKTFETGDFKVHYDETLVVDFKQISENIIKKKFTIVDARSESRFNGTGKEPREYLKSGSIENSINIPYQEVIKHGKFKSEKELNELFSKQYNNQKELVFSCGSGMTACIVLLASKICYRNKLKAKVYDGSWTEWAERNNLKT